MRALLSRLTLAASACSSCRGRMPRTPTPARKSKPPRRPLRRPARPAEVKLGGQAVLKLPDNMMFVPRLRPTA